MKRVFTILFVLFLGIPSIGQLATENSGRKCPAAPSLRELMKTSVTSLSDLTIEEEIKNHVTYRTYFKEGQLFTGWAYTLNTQTVHKFRFALIEEGKMRREVGYYGSGQIDFDFNFDSTGKHGCHLMWRENGTVYIDEFYENDQPHGRQLRLDANGLIERDEQFIQGVKVKN